MNIMVALAIAVGLMAGSGPGQPYCPPKNYYMKQDYVQDDKAFFGYWYRVMCDQSRRWER